MVTGVDGCAALRPEQQHEIVSQRAAAGTPARTTYCVSACACASEAEPSCQIRPACRSLRSSQPRALVELTQSTRDQLLLWQLERAQAQWAGVPGQQELLGSTCRSASSSSSSSSSSSNSDCVLRRMQAAGCALSGSHRVHPSLKFLVVVHRHLIAQCGFGRRRLLTAAKGEQAAQRSPPAPCGGRLRRTLRLLIGRGALLLLLTARHPRLTV